MTEQLDLFASFQPEEVPAARPAPISTPATFSPSGKSAAPARPVVRQFPKRGLLANPSGRAFEIGEGVARTWHSQHGGGHIEVPIGVVAALSFIRQKDPKGPDLKTQILAQSDRQLICMFQEIWSTHWIHRPDLIDRARILHEWLNDGTAPDKHRMYVVRAVTKSALDRGLFDITGHADPYLRAQADVLSPAITALRSLGAQQGLGEHHTPAAISDSIAEVTIGELAAGLQREDLERLSVGQHIHDPAAGSGGMLRSAAQILRRKGMDPADFVWSMVDIDPIAAACAAVNSMIWRLGPRVTVACADALAKPQAVEEAMAHARSVIEHRDRTLDTARMIAAVREAQQMLERVTVAA